MSSTACAWAADARASGRIPSGHRWVLYVLADHAHADGTSSYPSASTIASKLGVTVRSVQKSLRWLEDGGHIARGDQSLVHHIRSDRRPVVWDLQLTEVAASSGTNQSSHRGGDGTNATTRRSGDERYEQTGTNGTNHSSYKPKTEPTTETTPQTPRPKSLQPECEHGAPGGRSVLKSGGFRCALCRRDAARHESEQEAS